MEAGIEEINEIFGIAGTLDMVSRHTGVIEDELLKWSFYRFYYKVAYISHINAYQRRLQKIMMR